MFIFANVNHHISRYGSFDISVCTREFSNKMSALFTGYAVIQVYVRTFYKMCVCVLTESERDTST